MDAQRTEVALGSLTEIPENGMRQYEVDGKSILVCRAGGEIHAVDGVCPHRGAQLGQGQLTGTAVVCPWHDWEFDVSTGCGVTNPTSSLKKFEVVVRDGLIYLVTPCD